MKYVSHLKFLNIYVSKLFQYLAGLPSFLDLCKKVCKFWATKMPLLWGTSNLKMSGFTWLSWCSQLQMLFCFCQKPQFSISLQNHSGMISFLRCICIFVPIWCVIKYYCQSMKLCSKLIDFMINVNIVCTLVSWNRFRE